MSNLVINGKLVDYIDYEKTSNDLHNYLLEESRKKFIQQKKDNHKRMHTPIVQSKRKIGRNEPCPCGSGKKYKKCHGG